jgi:hypothetical protein
MLPLSADESETRSNVVTIRQALDKMRRDKPVFVELLTRFYFEEQKPAQIIAEMGITETQYRLGKSRAKAHLTRLVQRKQAVEELPLAA